MANKSLHGELLAFLSHLLLQEASDTPLHSETRHDTMKKKEEIFSVRSAYRTLVVNKEQATSYFENIAGRSDLARF